MDTALVGTGPRGFRWKMAMDWVVVVSVASVVTTISGCGLVPDKTLNYQEAQISPPITTPTGVAEPRRGQAYVVPDIRSNRRTSSAFSPSEDELVPRNTHVLNLDGMRQVELRHGKDDRPYLVVKRSRSEVFGSVKDFIDANRLTIQSLSPASGRIALEPLKPTTPVEQSWWKFGKPPVVREQLIVELSAISSNATRVQIDHQVFEQSRRNKSETDSADASATSGVKWTLVQENDEDHFSHVEGVLLDLGHYIDADDKNWRSPMVARRYETLPKVVKSVDGTGYPVITVVSDFNRAWGRVETLLDQSSRFELTDKNRSEAFFMMKVPTFEGDLQLRLDQVETGVVITLQKDDNTLAPLPLTESIIDELERGLQS